LVSLTRPADIAAPLTPQHAKFMNELYSDPMCAAILALIAEKDPGFGGPVFVPLCPTTLRGFMFVIFVVHAPFRVQDELRGRTDRFTHRLHTAGAAQDRRSGVPNTFDPPFSVS